MTLSDLHAKITTQTATVAVIGLGYVGLPVACKFAQAGCTVTGVDIKQSRVQMINRGQSPIEGDEPGLDDLLSAVVTQGRLHVTPDYAELATADVVLICVDTPVDQNHRPQYRALESASRSLGQVITPGTLVVIESTVAPGTVNGPVRALLEEASGMAAHRDFYLGTCPERVMPGRLLKNLRVMSRVCGGGTPETAEAMVAFYRHVVEADLDTADITTAELVKTTENAYRDVQIAFANEVAKICEVNGADVWRVRELVNKSPFRNMHMPGAGVGGHCIPKDPWLLAHSAGDAVSLALIPAARSINETMPNHVAGMVVSALEATGQIITQARVAVLGYAYLENSDDTRHSPTASLVARLHKMVSHVIIHDPWVAQYQGDVYRLFRNADAIVLMVKHDAYRELDLARAASLMRTPILVDGRGFFDPQHVESAGLRYRGVGRG